MNDVPDTPATAEPPGREHQVMVQTYRILSGVALLAIVLLEASDGLSFTVPLILLFGLVGIVWKFPAAPILVLLFFIVGQLLRAAMWTGGQPWHRGPEEPTVEMPDMVLAGALVAFFAAQYRLYGLRAGMVPFDLRRKRRLGLGAMLLTRRDKEAERPRRTVSLYEAPTLVLLLPLWVLIGQILWLVIGAYRSGIGLEPWAQRLILLVWIMGIPALVVGSLLNYWKRLGMSPDEARLFLQDTHWRETGREQRSVGRFLAWARLRRKRREESAR